MRVRRSKYIHYYRYHYASTNKIPNQWNQDRTLFFGRGREGRGRWREGEVVRRCGGGVGGGGGLAGTPPMFRLRANFDAMSIFAQ